MNKSEISELLASVVNALKDDLHYEYRMISAQEILENKTDLLEQVPQVSQVGNRKVQIQRAYRNRNIIGQYLNEVGEKGWELVTTFEFSGRSGYEIPFGGALIFRRLAIPKEFEDIENIYNMFFEPVGKSIDELIQEFEETTGKEAIWKNQITNSFRTFLQNYGVEE